MLYAYVAATLYGLSCLIWTQGHPEAAGLWLIAAAGFSVARELRAITEGKP